MRSSRLMLLAIVLSTFSSSIVRAREWTYDTGRTIEARFIRMHEGQVVLMRGKKVMKVDFYQLSDADQQYLRDELSAKGLSHQILPPRPKNQPEEGGSPQQTAGPPPGMSMPHTPRFGPPAGMFPAANAMAAQARAEHDRFVAESRQRHERMVQEARSRDIASSTMPSMAPSYSTGIPTMRHASVAPPMSAPSTFPTSTPTYTPTMPSSNSNGGSYMQKICESCDKPVPDSSTVGGKCPHCGVTWDYDRTDPSAGSSWRGRKLAYRGGVFLVLVIGGFLVKLFRGSD